MQTCKRQKAENNRGCSPAGAPAGAAYPAAVKGEFISRPNRFIAEVSINGQTVAVHVKNTGRCRELLIPGTAVYLTPAANPGRKTPFDLIAVEKQRPGRPPLLINIDSQMPNAAAAAWLPRSGLFSPEYLIRREAVCRRSRFDFQISGGGRTLWLEVKGVTLEKDGIALFPDAPTARGVKHLQELAEEAAAGREAWVLFVIQMKEIREFRPNDGTDPEFGAALRAAAAQGVKILARDCLVTPESMTIDRHVSVCL